MQQNSLVASLSSLQLQILTNELPPLLAAYNARLSEPSQPQVLHDLINGILAIQREEFISGVVEKICTDQQQIRRLMDDNAGLQDRLRVGQLEANKVDESIRELIQEKNYLATELDGLKGEYRRLSALMNSSNVENRIREIMRENGELKLTIENGNKLMQAKSMELQSLLNKQAMYHKQIQELTNDNILFHNDLGKAHEFIARLQQDIQTLAATDQQQLQKKQQTISKLHSQLQASISQCHSLQAKVKQLTATLTTAQSQSQALTSQHSALEQSRNTLNSALQQARTELLEARAQLEHTGSKLSFEGQAARDMQARLEQERASWGQRVDRMQQEQENRERILGNKLELLSQELITSEEKYARLMGEFMGYRGQVLHEKQLLTEEYQQSVTELKLKSNCLESQLTQLKQKYQEELSALTNQLSLQKQQQQHYETYLHENNQLTCELARLTHKLTSPTARLPNRSTMYLLQLAQQVRSLALENNELKNYMSLNMESLRRWVMKEMSKLVRVVMEKKAECEACGHWEQYETRKEAMGDGKVPGKALRGVNEKYKLLLEHNEKFSHRIKQMINH